MPLPEIPSYKSKGTKATSAPSSDSAINQGKSDDGGASGTKIALRTEEEQQAAARDREEREKAALEKEIQDRREARRKSLANRRVSFAAEATLHTFHEIEYMQDSTTSTDSTRRASSVAAQSPAPRSTENDEDQRRLHQKNRRRSSGVASESDLSGHGDDTMASTVYDSDSDEGDDVAEVQTDVSNSDSDFDSDGTMVTVEAEEMTSVSLSSTRYGADDGETTSSLDGALREAARRAVNQAREPDEGEEVIPGFVGWGKNARQRQQQQQAAVSQEEPPSDNSFPSSSPLKSSPLKEDIDETEMGMDMDMTSAVGGIIDPNVLSSPVGDMSMDVTNAYGGILPNDDEPAEEEQTMEFTTAVGTIQREPASDADSGHQSDEEMSMELTTVMGRVLAAKNKQLQGSFQQSSSPVKDPADGDAPMDVTLDMGGMGRILPGSNANAEEDVDGDDTVGMDITTAVGGILQSQPTPESRAAAKQLMEQEVDQPETTDAPELASMKASPKQPLSSTNQGSQRSPAISAFHGKGLRRSSGLLFPPAPKSPPKSTNTTPLSQRKTRSQGPASPSHSPTRRMSRTSSPQTKILPARGPSPQAKATPNSSFKSSIKLSNSLFQQDSTLPLVVLTPQRPKLSGVGIDRSGIGSPRITEIFDRRGSIGESAAAFSPITLPGQRKIVAFEDPKVLEEEIDRERRDDQDRESGRRSMEKEADGGSDDREATLNLKELISGLSPKKNPFKGRKSLHVGSARGLLGKRPSELDNDSDTEEQDGIKRLKGLQGSPVKNIRLQQPPSKAETTGSRATVSRMDDVDDHATPTTRRSPQKSANVTTPKDQGRFRNFVDDQPSTTINFNATPSANLPELQPSDGEDRLHLQDFLNMTSIRFMELTTTKRRNTVMPSARKDSMSADGKEDISLEKCVVAGACTVPMLELYQHSCRELKKYISEGRRIVREIETETFEENPPLFKEYISASPEFKTLMDNQFKNVKTHARLLSKAMWYEWRMKLQDGLKEGLIKTAEGMTTDEKFFDKQQKLLSSILPALVKQSEAMSRECENLEAVASELEDCDPQELEAARSDLVAAEEHIEAKTREVAQLQQQLQETEHSIGQLAERKRSCHSDIKEAEKIRQDCRGWSSGEIGTLKARVKAIEKQHGWAITGVQGTTMSMTYRREIELVLDVASFHPGQQNSRIDLWYVATTREQESRPPTPEIEFCLQCIRDHIRGLPQSHTRLSRMLKVVSAAWDCATTLANQVYQLNLTCPTLVTRVSDASVAIKTSLLLAALQTKVEIVLGIHSSTGPDGLEFRVSAQAGVIYGEQFNATKLAEFLTNKVGDRIYARNEKQTDLWCDVVSDLRGKLLARSKKY
ncbi:Spc7-domain-containing protein [Cryphonectria parasitica EP155]|uniref:Spc7-domain-containing protein n=1 Tax=Cryphonectria parasitica (strain ATCC 38755 / EP155) TaxID=660469 RepID=A0A9P5CMT6_CRYP1|nr:Spc7-domain-containing protein [Cryphonectria parasitica EP155]KAF3764463.1 Spc7-domain-containing protein [Cryphonectria parasitica EP155]